MIKIENISKSFDQVKVVDNISTVFDKGKTNLIIGQSGSGKTVLMKCLVGLLNIDNGKIFFEDKSFNSLSFSNLSTLRKEIGMVFQGSALFDSMSVLENIIFPLRISNASKIPLEVILLAIFFNLINGFTNGYYLGNYGKGNPP